MSRILKTDNPGDRSALQWVLRGKITDVQTDQGDLLIGYDGGRIVRLRAVGTGDAGDYLDYTIEVEDITVPIETVKETP